MKIGELAKRAGVATTAIRYWEGEGLLRPPARVSGRRDYGADAITRIGMIRGCQDAGFTIAETREVVDALERGEQPLSRAWKRMAHAKLAVLARQVEKLEAMRAFLQTTLACDCTRVEDCALLIRTNRGRS